MFWGLGLGLGGFPLAEHIRGTTGGPNLRYFLRLVSGESGPRGGEGVTRARRCLWMVPSVIIYYAGYEELRLRLLKRRLTPDQVSWERAEGEGAALMRRGGVASRQKTCCCVTSKNTFPLRQFQPPPFAPPIRPRC